MTGGRRGRVKKFLFNIHHNPYEVRLEKMRPAKGRLIVDICIQAPFSISNHEAQRRSSDSADYRHNNSLSPIDYNALTIAPRLDLYFANEFRFWSEMARRCCGKNE